MLREETNKDISDKEFNKIIRPFIDNYDEYIESYIMPEVIAYYIANGYYRNYLSNCIFIRHYNSAKDIINYFDEDFIIFKAKALKLLRIKCELQFF